MPNKKELIDQLPDFKTNYKEYIIYFLAVIGLGALFCIVGVLILTSTTEISRFSMGSSNNLIGDAIGGITAPIIGIITTGFMFIAFLAQYKFNKFQYENYKHQLILNKEQYEEQLENQRRMHEEQMLQLASERTQNAKDSLYETCLTQMASIETYFWRLHFKLNKNDNWSPGTESVIGALNSIDFMTMKRKNNLMGAGDPSWPIGNFSELIKELIALYTLVLKSNFGKAKEDNFKSRLTVFYEFNLKRILNHLNGISLEINRISNEKLKEAALSNFRLYMFPLINLNNLLFPKKPE